ncbi:MAG: glycosyltransferase family 4 protein, partial [Actinomycetota bacterium]|nr:glycosyltransferase family 4 protein [Actinomycetota bacterium]
CLADHPTAHDVVLQTHALFELTDPRAVLYIDCTHQQSMRQWTDWNPLRGKELERWLERERRQYHAAAHLFAFSHQTRESIVVDYGVPAERVTVVAAGVNFEHVPEQALVGNTNTPPTILFVGNDFVRKGGEQLLEAFRVVRERVPDAQLQLVGTPHSIAAQPGVEVLGRVNGRGKMTRLYASADVFAMPSFFDPFPLVVLEAMAHGLPVVASPTCGVPEMVVEGRTGLLVPADTSMVERLADALVAVLTDPAKAAAMGRAGRERVTERFLWRHVADRMAPVLEGMASRVG